MNAQRSFANGNGESASGPDVTPLWLKGNWEYAMARAAQANWNVQS